MISIKTIILLTLSLSSPAIWVQLLQCEYPLREGWLSLVHGVSDKGQSLTLTNPSIVAESVGPAQLQLGLKQVTTRGGGQDAAELTDTLKFIFSQLHRYNSGKII